jgi:long-chain acyl-CoA synthetase
VLTSIGQLLTDAARRHADKPYLVCVDGTFSFSQIDRLATNFAQQLRRAGIGPGDVVGLWVENGWRWVAAYYGIFRAGCVVTPLNSLLTPDEVAFIVRDCNARALIADTARGRAVCDKTGMLLLDDLSDSGLFAPMESSGDTSAELQTTPSRADQMSGDEVSTICYTSGTTGRPKGAVLSHRGVMLNTCMMALMHGRTAADIVVSALPCTHVYGNVVMNSAAVCGLTLVLLPRFEEAAALEAIQRNRATMFEGVPTMYLRMLNDPSFEKTDLRSLRLCTVGGQAMPVPSMREVERRFGAPLHELWGMTELAGVGTTNPYNWPSRMGSIGVAAPWSEIRIVDPADSSRTLPRGEVGEMLIRSPTVMQGYLGNEAATAEALEPDGWLHTGDLVYQDKDSYCFVVERRKEVILCGGYNVYPAEIERVIAEHPSVAMVAVGRVKDTELGEVAKAYVVLRAGGAPCADEVIALCKTRLARYKVPRSIQFVKDFPRTSTGKILRRELHVLDAADASAAQ